VNGEFCFPHRLVADVSPVNDERAVVYVGWF